MSKPSDCNRRRYLGISLFARALQLDKLTFRSDDSLIDVITEYVHRAGLVLGADLDAVDEFYAEARGGALPRDRPLPCRGR